MRISRRDFLKGVLVSGAVALVPTALFREQVEKMLPTDTAVYWKQAVTKPVWQFVTSSKASALEDLSSGCGISNVKIYNRALSQEEVNLIYQREKHLYGGRCA